MIQRKKQWTNEEIEMLESIKKTFKQKKWKLISKNLAKKGYKRSQHQCRHKWVNCLNPLINHGPWTEQELTTLYSEYQKSHSQWSIIQKALPTRTQIRIKNHFYGVLRNIMRFVLKYFKNIPGKQSQISNKINPNSLQYIYRGEAQYNFLKNEIKNAIFSMEFHFDKQKLFKIIEKNKSIYQQLNKKLLEQINRLNNEEDQNKTENKQKQKQKEKSSPIIENRQKAIPKSTQSNVQRIQKNQEFHQSQVNNLTNLCTNTPSFFHQQPFYQNNYQPFSGYYFFLPQSTFPQTIIYPFQNNNSFQSPYIKYQQQQ